MPLEIAQPRLGEPTPAKRPAPVTVAPATPADYSLDGELNLTPRANGGNQFQPLRATTVGDVGEPPPATTAPNVMRVGNEIVPANVLPADSLPADASPVQPVSARDLLRAAMGPQDGGRLMSLREVLDGVTSRQQQLNAVKIFWQLAVAVADYHHSRDEVSFLENVEPSPTAHEQARLQAALAVARARQREAELAVIAVQQDLSDSLPSAIGEMPIPADIPFVGAYRTKFDELFANRPVPQGLRKINRMLPRQLELIDARAESVDAAGQAVVAFIEAYQAGQVNMAAVLDAHVRLRDQRIALLATVRDYNFAIAEYAMGVASPGVNVDSLVAMLIETAPATRSVLVPKSGVQPASALQPVSTDQFVPRKTQAENPPTTLSPADPIPIESPTNGGLTPVGGSQPPAQFRSGDFR